MLMQGASSLLPLSCSLVVLVQSRLTLICIVEPSITTPTRAGSYYHALTGPQLRQSSGYPLVLAHDVFKPEKLSGEQQRFLFSAFSQSSSCPNPQVEPCDET